MIAVLVAIAGTAKLFEPPVFVAEKLASGLL